MSLLNQTSSGDLSLVAQKLERDFKKDFEVAGVMNKEIGERILQCLSIIRYRQEKDRSDIAYALKMFQVGSTETGICILKNLIGENYKSDINCGQYDF